LDVVHSLLFLFFDIVDHPPSTVSHFNALLLYQIKAMSARIFALLLPVLWTALNDPGWINRKFRHVLPSLQRISELANLLEMEFCPGLFEVLQSSTPPTIAWFLSVNFPAPAKHWGIYAVVLQKPGRRCKLYIGSSTEAQRGIVTRWNNYDDGSLIPKYI